MCVCCVCACVCVLCLRVCVCVLCLCVSGVVWCDVRVGGNLYTCACCGVMPFDACVRACVRTCPVHSRADACAHAGRQQWVDDATSQCHLFVDRR